MKFLESGEIRLRSRWRRVRNKLPVGTQKPAKIRVRLDDLDAPGPVPAGSGASLDAWQERILEVMEGGVVPVEFVARPLHPRLDLLVRFCHRLEAPTTLRTEVAGLELRAEALVDSGLDRIWVRVGAPGDLGGLEAAIRALLWVRKDRGFAMKIGVEAPFVAAWARELPGLFRQAKELGVDHVRVVAPFVGPAWDAKQAVMLDIMALDRPPFNATAKGLNFALEGMTDAQPGRPRRFGSCQQGSTVELLPDFSIRSCPFQEGAATEGVASGALSQHRARIRACKRECWHEDLRDLTG